MTALMYSVAVPNSPSRPGEGKPRRSVLCPEKLLENYPSAEPGKTVRTLYDNFLEGVYRAEGGQFLGHRPVVNGIPHKYTWQTYGTVKDRVAHFGAG
ncbi:hypothetical protein EDD11_001617, partial [Mortierella claussenii]